MQRKNKKKKKEKKGCVFQKLKKIEQEKKRNEKKKMGLFGIFGGGNKGGGGGGKDEDKPARKRQVPRGSADPGDPYSWENTRGENSAYSLLEKEEKAGFPGIGDDVNDPSTAAGMSAAAAGANRKVKLTDKDRHVFQYARNMTSRQTWCVELEKTRENWGSEKRKKKR